MNPITLALADLRRRPWSVAASALALALAVACAGALLRLYRLQAARFAGLVDAGDALVAAKAGGVEALLGALRLEGPYPGFLPDRLYRTLARGQSLDFGDGRPAYGRQVRWLVPLAVCGRFGGHRVIGTDGNFPRQPCRPAVALAAGAWPSGPGTAALGAEVARERGLAPGSEILVDPWSGNSPATVIPRRLRVAGVLAPRGDAWDGAVFTDLSTARGLLAAGGDPAGSVWGSEVLNYLLVYLEPGAWDRLEELVDQRTVAQAVSLPAARAELARLTAAGKALALASAGLSACLGLLCAAAVAGGQARARRSQAAVLGALRWTRAELAAWAFWSGLGPGLAACALGAALEAAALGPLAALFPGPGRGETLALPPWWTGWPVWAAALAMSLASTVLPLAFRPGDAHRELQRA